MKLLMHPRLIARFVDDKGGGTITRHSRLLITSVDTYVAGRLRRRRLVVGLSLRDAAGRLGLSWQQLAKYERAVDRISAGNLCAIASLLGVTVGYFFEGLGRPTQPTGDLPWRERASPAGRQQLHTGRLVSAYWRIKSPTARKAILDMTRMLAEKSDESVGKGIRANLEG
jgi:transcriptional regulator with XRE-family HTH domain